MPNGSMSYWLYMEVAMPALKRKDITSTEKLVYLYLGHRQGRNENTWVSARRIAADLVLSPRTVKRVLAKLVDVGLLQPQGYKEGSSLMLRHVRYPRTSDTHDTSDVPLATPPGDVGDTGDVPFDARTGDAGVTGDVPPMPPRTNHGTESELNPQQEGELADVWTDGYVRAFYASQTIRYHVTDADVAALRQMIVDYPDTTPADLYDVAKGVLDLGRMAGASAFTLAGFCRGWPGFRAKAGTAPGFHVEHDARALYKVRMDEHDHSVAEMERAAASSPDDERIKVLLTSRQAARARTADRGWEAYVNEVKSRRTG